VTIEGAGWNERMLVQNYTDGNSPNDYPNGTLENTIDPGRSRQTSGWVIEYTEVAHNAAEGIGLGSNNEVVEHNYVHDNGQLGMGGGGNNIVVEGNIVSANGDNLVAGAMIESGGIKIESGKVYGPVNEQNAAALVEYNWIVGNASGPGFHTDCGADGVWLVNNLIMNNQQKGVLFEISNYDIALGNIVADNVNAGVQISASWNQAVNGNTIENNGGAIVLDEFTRSQPQTTHPSCWTPNTGTGDFTASSNTVINSGHTGTTDSTGNTGASFTDDAYSGADSWGWEGVPNLSFAQWRTIFPGD
jgi:parallel beta helix pectate lyase-like protein